MTPAFLEPQSVAGLATLIAAITAAAVSIGNSFSGARNRKELNKKVDDAADKAHTAATRAEAANDTLSVVAVQTNGHLSALREELIRLSAENFALHQTIATLSTALASVRLSDRRSGAIASSLPSDLPPAAAAL